MMPAPAPLVNRADLDKFEDGDTEYHVAAAEAEVRSYCGWHIAPARVETARGIIGGGGWGLLRTLHLVAVTSVTVAGRELDPSDYRWTTDGILQLPPDYQHQEAVSTFVHGHDVCPPNVASVVFEVASSAIEMPASPARDITAGPFRLTLGSSVGATLNRNQKDRLANYRLIGVR